MLNVSQTHLGNYILSYDPVKTEHKSHNINPNLQSQNKQVRFTFEKQERYKKNSDRNAK